MIDMKNGSFHRTRSGKVTGRVTKGDTGFEAVVDGKVRIFDAAGGAVHGGDDIVEEWVPRVGERVRFVRDNTDGGAEYGAKGEVVTVMWATSDVASSHVDVSSSRFTWHPCAYLSDLEPLPVAPQPAAPALKIEAGRYYKTRDGRKVGPMEPAKYTDGWYDAATRVTSQRWEKDGAFIPGEPSALDLIAEWQDTPAAPVSAQVDAIAEEYGPPPAEPDTTLHIKFTSDFSELDAAILVRKKKLKKLIKLARKAGIELREAA